MKSGLTAIFFATTAGLSAAYADNYSHSYRVDLADCSALGTVDLVVHASGDAAAMGQIVTSEKNHRGRWQFSESGVSSGAVLSGPITLNSLNSGRYLYTIEGFGTAAPQLTITNSRNTKRDVQCAPRAMQSISGPDALLEELGPLIDAANRSPKDRNAYLAAYLAAPPMQAFGQNFAQMTIAPRVAKLNQDIAQYNEAVQAQVMTAPEDLETLAILRHNFLMAPELEIDRDSYSLALHRAALSYQTRGANPRDLAVTDPAEICTYLNTTSGRPRLTMASGLSLGYWDSALASLYAEQSYPCKAGTEFAAGLRRDWSKLQQDLQAERWVLDQLEALRAAPATLAAQEAIGFGVIDAQAARAVKADNNTILRLIGPELAAYRQNTRESLAHELLSQLQSAGAPAKLYPQFCDNWANEARKKHRTAQDEIAAIAKECNALTQAATLEQLAADLEAAQVEWPVNSQDLAALEANGFLSLAALMPSFPYGQAQETKAAQEMIAQAEAAFAAEREATIARVLRELPSDAIAAGDYAKAADTCGQIRQIRVLDRPSQQAHREACLAAGSALLEARLLAEGGAALDAIAVAHQEDAALHAAKAIKWPELPGALLPTDFRAVGQSVDAALKEKRAAIEADFGKRIDADLTDRIAAADIAKGSLEEAADFCMSGLPPRDTVAGVQMAQSCKPKVAAILQDKIDAEATRLVAELTPHAERARPFLIALSALDEAQSRNPFIAEIYRAGAFQEFDINGRIETVLAKEVELISAEIAASTDLEDAEQAKAHCPSSEEIALIGRTAGSNALSAFCERQINMVLAKRAAEFACEPLLAELPAALRTAAFSGINDPNLTMTEMLCRPYGEDSSFRIESEGIFSKDWFVIREQMLRGTPVVMRAKIAPTENREGEATFSDLTVMPAVAENLPKTSLDILAWLFADQPRLNLQ